MKKFSVVFWIVCFSLLIHTPVFSQVDVAQDSLTDQQLDESENFLQAVDSIRLQDSLAQRELEMRLELMKKGDAEQRAKIQKQLDSLERVQQNRAEKTKRQVDSLRATTIGVPVTFHDDTLYFIFSKLGPFGPTDRAKSVVDKLDRLVESGSYDTSLIHLSVSEESCDILHGDMILLTLTDRDAFWMNSNPEQACLELVDTINTSVLNYLDETSISRMTERLIWLGVVILLLFLIIKYLRRGIDWLNKKLIDRLRPKIKGISLKDYEFLSVSRVEGIIGWLLNVFKWLVIFLIVYLALPTIFSIFPATEGIARQLIEYILDPMKSFGRAFVNYIPELFSIAVIVFITRYVVRLMNFLAVEIASGKLVIPGFYPDWARPTLNLVKVIVYAFSFIMIFPYLPGSDSPIFQGVSVFLGLLISFGSSSAISNIVSGLVITYMRPFKKGDRVRIGDTTGDVIEKTMLVTRLRTIKNEDVTIPNSSILTGNTVNYTSSSQDLGLILHATVTIGYDVPWRTVHELLISAAIDTELIINEPKPYVLQTSLDDNYVSYQINGYTKAPEKAARIYSELYGFIQDKFNEAGVEILSPHYRAHRDGNIMTVPPEYIPDGYQKPGFDVNVNQSRSE